MKIKENGHTYKVAPLGEKLVRNLALVAIGLGVVGTLLCIVLFILVVIFIKAYVH